MDIKKDMRKIEMSKSRYIDIPAIMQVIGSVYQNPNLLDNESYHFYHGKVLRFNTNEHSYILYGSANCTQAALKKSFLESGNIECDILSIGDINEYDYSNEAPEVMVEGKDCSTMPRQSYLTELNFISLSQLWCDST